MEGSCRSRRTPQENWDVRPISPEVNGLLEKGDKLLFYMNVQLDVIFAVVLSISEYSKNEFVTSYPSAGTLK